MIDGALLNYDTETERHLMSAIFDSPKMIWEVRQMVAHTDFANPRISAVYMAMCATADRGQLPTVIAVSDYVIKNGMTAQVDVTYLHELTGLGASGYQAYSYAEIVREHGERRRLAELADRMRQLAEQGDTDGGDIIEKAQQELVKVRAETLRESHTIGERFDEYLGNLRKSTPYTPSPWASLNEMIGGIRPEGLYTVAARSGGGKSIFGLQLAAHVAELGGRVLYVTMEMSEESLWKRLVSMMKGIDQRALQNNALTDAGFAAVESARTAVKSLPLEIYDKAGVTFEEIVGRARALEQKGDLKLIVIDYFGLISTPATSQASRQEVLSAYANGFKTLAKELKCAIVLLEQVNRDSTARKSPRPIVSDLRGTAALEHAADAVIFLHREEKKVGGKIVMSREIHFIVPKNRNGSPGERELIFQGEYARIMQKEYTHDSLIPTEQVI